MSLSAGRAAAKIFVPGFEEWSAEKQEAFAEKIDYPVRKAAHAGEYAVLGILMAASFRLYLKWKGIRLMIVTWAAAVIYAATDEFHQLFVPGRSGQLSDIMLDGAGAAAGILLCAAIAGLIGKKTRYCGRESS